MDIPCGPVLYAFLECLYSPKLAFYQAFMILTFCSCLLECLAGSYPPSFLPSMKPLLVCPLLCDGLSHYSGVRKFSIHGALVPSSALRSSHIYGGIFSTWWMPLGDRALFIFVFPAVDDFHEFYRGTVWLWKLCFTSKLLQTDDHGLLFSQRTSFSPPWF